MAKQMVMLSIMDLLSLGVIEKIRLVWWNDTNKVYEGVILVTMVIGMINIKQNQ